jgi:hypothetical protein
VAHRTLAVCFFLFITSGWAEDWAGAAQRLARQVAVAARPRQSVTLSIENRSTATAAEIATARRALETELRRAGLRPGGAGASLEVRSVIAENVRENIWTVEAAKGGETFVAVAAVARSAAAASETNAGVALEAALVWSQPRQILDVAFPAQNRALVLDVDRVLLLERKDHWSAASSAALPLAEPLPRDPRGRIQISGSGWTAWLPGTICTGQLDPLSASCRRASEPWPTAAGPAHLAAGRNYFEGPTPFYSAAAWKNTLLLAALDRRVLLQGESVAAWGSDLATVTSQCGAAEQVLATRATAPGEADAITAYELPARQPQAVSSPLDFSGPVTALWSAGARAAAVVFNLKASRYEAYSLAIACPR